MITSHTLSECSVYVTNIQLLLLFSSKLSSTCDDTAPNMSCTLSRDCDISSLSAPADRSAPAAVYLSIPLVLKILQSVDQTVLLLFRGNLISERLKIYFLAAPAATAPTVYILLIIIIYISFNPPLRLHKNLGPTL